MRTTTGRALSLLVGAALLAGCGEGEKPPAAEPSDSPTSASSESTESTEPSEPAVEPASGARVELGSLTLRFPDGYEPREMGGTGGLGAQIVTSSGPGGERLALTTFKSLGPVTLDESVESAIETGMWVGKPKRLDDVEVDGVLMYHLSGPSGIGYTDERFGAEFGGYDMSFTVSAQGSKAAREELIDSILSTVRWT